MNALFIMYEIYITQTALISILLIVLIIILLILLIIVLISIEVPFSDSFLDAD